MANGILRLPERTEEAVSEAIGEAVANAAAKAAQEAVRAQLVSVHAPGTRVVSPTHVGKEGCRGHERDGAERRCQEPPCVR